MGGMDDKSGEENCGNCRCFRRHQVGEPNGVCRYNPPVPLIDGALKHPITHIVTPKVNGYWAPTTDAEWCYQHVPGEAALSHAPLATVEQVVRALTAVETEGTA